MSLQEKIKEDLKESMKAKTAERTSAIRIIMGEFARQSKKELDDQEVQAIIRKLIKSERETLATSAAEDSEYIAILEAYLPQMASEEEISAWIAANVDFAQFKNKMQAMKPIMAHFGGRADGNMVKTILNSLA
ncbi:MAG: GatB/YqeY domain-containing protein [Thermodesulfobacteriota bacterium]